MKKVHGLKEETKDHKDGLGYDSEGRLEKLKRNDVNKGNICNDANSTAIKSIEQKL